MQAQLHVISLAQQTRPPQKRYNPTLQILPKCSMQAFINNRNMQPVVQNPPPQPAFQKNNYMQGTGGSGRRNINNNQGRGRWQNGHHNNQNMFGQNN